MTGPPTLTEPPTVAELLEDVGQLEAAAAQVGPKAQIVLRFGERCPWRLAARDGGIDAIEGRRLADIVPRRLPAGSGG